MDEWKPDRPSMERDVNANDATPKHSSRGGTISGTIHGLGGGEWVEIEVTRLIQQLKEMDKRVGRVEAQTEYQQKDLQRILEAQASNKVQVETVIKRLDSMEQNILRQLAEHLSHHGNNDDGKQRMWMDLFKWVLGGTIVTIVAYIFAT